MFIFWTRTRHRQSCDVHVSSYRPILYGCRPSVHGSVFHYALAWLAPFRHRVCALSRPPLSHPFYIARPSPRVFLTNASAGAGVWGWRWAGEVRRMRHPTRRPDVTCGVGEACRFPLVYSPLFGSQHLSAFLVIGCASHTLLYGCESSVHGVAVFSPFFLLFILYVQIPFSFSLTALSLRIHTSIL